MLKHDSHGRIIPGTHWRERRPWWKKEWLEHQYVTQGKSTGDIAKEHNVTDGAIIFWLRKHGIPRRSISEARQIKHWGLEGIVNGMFGKCGPLSPVWQGGLTPLRQRIYCKSEWRSFVRAVKRRDKQCLLCGSTDHLVIHHIDKFSQAPLLVMDMGNVIRLCSACHRKLQGRENRWKKKLFALLRGGDAKYGQQP